MRFLKKLLVGMFAYAAVLLAVCFVAWCVTGEEPSALLACAAAMWSTETIVGALIKIKEKAMAEKARKIEKSDNINNT